MILMTKIHFFCLFSCTDASIMHILITFSYRNYVLAVPLR